MSTFDKLKPAKDLNFLKEEEEKRLLETLSSGIHTNYSFNGD